MRRGRVVEAKGKEGSVCDDVKREEDDERKEVRGG